MKKLFYVFLTLALIVTSCQEGDEAGDGDGRLILKITDAPFPIEIIEDATVTVVRGELWETGEDSANRYILFDDTVSVNLLELQNGITQELADVEIPVGTYSHARLYITDASISLQDYGTFEMKVPGGATGGLKIFVEPAVRVAEELTSELLLDFDLSRSFVLKGNIETPAGINGFNFKPVVRAVNNSFAGRVQGYVKDTSGNTVNNASIWLEQDSIISTTFSDSTGFYAMIGIPSGEYELFAAGENYDTLRTDISVVEGNLTFKELMLIPAE